MHSLELDGGQLSSVSAESKLTPTTLASNEIPFSSIISKCLNDSTPLPSLRQRPLRSLSFMASSYHERYENISSLSELPRSGLSPPSLFRERDPNNPFQVDPASPFLGSSWKSGTDSGSGKLNKAVSASPFLARLQNLTPSPDIISRKITNYTGYNDGLDEKLESTTPTSLERDISQQQSPPSLLRSIASRKSSFLINRASTSESMVSYPTFNKSPSPPKAAGNLLLGWRRHQSMITRRGEFMNTLTPSPIQRQVVPDNKSPLRLASSRYSPDQHVEECQILPYTSKPGDITKRVSPETVVDVLEGKYLSKYDVVYVIDCRFPYEYKGGHIRNAINVNTKDTLDKLLLRPAITDMRVLVIFHCEFSCERGPRMAGYLRNQDRIANADNYPALFYPEIYVMEGGYSGFFKTNKLYCEPQAYVEMQDASHSVEFKEHMRTFGREFSRITGSSTDAFININFGTQPTTI
ncbi:cell division cycle- protein [Lunasporangiospora selenospora]|uniref:M-phase inducer phosphatase n=1 Tax=Lunasporangiospora selenospora TaxID=979761 RepID=A0A9P6FZ26_9FUNG|nr:cell division cycle- protein [Lunasporangiospora selenospora]